MADDSPGIRPVDRRSVLKGMAAAGLPGIGSVAADATTGHRIGVQLYTLRGLMQDDVAGTLALVAETGYEYVELAGLHGESPVGFRRLLDAAGLIAPSTHVALDAMREDFDAVLAAGDTLGNEYIVMPYLLEHQRQSIGDYYRLAEALNGWGARCLDGGMTLAYHNHDFEFETLDGEVPWDVLLAETDAALVRMQLDLYWVTKAGRDPLDVIAADPGRYPLWHVKDMAEDGRFADVGDGVIDFAAIFRQADVAGLDLAFVEHDAAQDPGRTIRRSLAHLRTL